MFAHRTHCKHTAWRLICNQPDFCCGFLLEEFLPFSGTIVMSSRVMCRRSRRVACVGTQPREEEAPQYPRALATKPAQLEGHLD